VTHEDPLERALQRREAERRASEQAGQQHGLDSQAAAESLCQEQLKAAKRFQHLGQTFLRHADALPQKKVYYRGCVEVRGRFGGTRIQRGGWLRAIIVEKSLTYSSSTGDFTSGTDLFVLSDGRILTGYSDEQEVADRLAAFLHP
jgi:hypothetical protein